MRLRYEHFWDLWMLILVFWRVFYADFMHYVVVLSTSHQTIVLFLFSKLLRLLEYVNHPNAQGVIIFLIVRWESNVRPLNLKFPRNSTLSLENFLWFHELNAIRYLFDSLNRVIEKLLATLSLQEYLQSLRILLLWLHIENLYLFLWRIDRPFDLMDKILASRVVNIQWGVLSPISAHEIIFSFIFCGVHRQYVQNLLTCKPGNWGLEVFRYLLTLIVLVFLKPYDVILKRSAENSVFKVVWNIHVNLIGWHVIIVSNRVIYLALLAFWPCRLVDIKNLYLVFSIPFGSYHAFVIRRAWAFGFLKLELNFKDLLIKLNIILIFQVWNVECHLLNGDILHTLWKVDDFDIMAVEYSDVVRHLLFRIEVVKFCWIIWLNKSNGRVLVKVTLSHDEGLLVLVNSLQQFF